MKYEHIFESILEQKEIACTYLKIMDIRKEILKEQEQDQDQQDDEDDQDHLSLSQKVYK